MNRGKCGSLQIHAFSLVRNLILKPSSRDGWFDCQVKKASNLDFKQGLNIVAVVLFVNCIQRRRVHTNYVDQLNISSVSVKTVNLSRKLSKFAFASISLQSIVLLLTER